MSLKTIGTDTELFAVDKNGVHRSLCGLIGGSKERPLQIKTLPKGFAVQEDNVALEFNIPPVKTEYDFVKCIEVMMNQNAEILKAHDLSISNKSSVSFEDGELTHPQALVFGCEPDYNTWLMLENPKPQADNPNLRTAGGHVHVGTQNDIVQATKNMDLFLGVPSILLDDTPESIERRKLYGKAGALRPKPYGFEYRTLSNFWVFKPELVAYVFQQTREAMRYKKNISESYGKKIQHAINTGDKDVATAIIKHFGLATPNGIV